MSPPFSAFAQVSIRCPSVDICELHAFSGNDSRMVSWASCYWGYVTKKFLNNRYSKFLQHATLNIMRHISFLWADVLRWEKKTLAHHYISSSGSHSTRVSSTGSYIDSLSLMLSINVINILWICVHLEYICFPKSLPRQKIYLVRIPNFTPPLSLQGKHFGKHFQKLTPKMLTRANRNWFSAFFGKECLPKKCLPL